MVTKPDTNEKAHLHPFISLRILHEALGSDNEGIPLSTMQETFTVSPKAFINVEYPVSTVSPTKTVVNGTKTVHEEDKDAEVGLVVTYAILMFICLILIIVFAKCLCAKNQSGD